VSATARAQSEPDAARSPYLTLALAVVFISVGSILVRWAQAPALSVAFYRIFLASVFLRSPSAPAHAESRVTEEPTALQRGYLPVLNGALARPVLSLALAVAVLGGTVALVPLLETNFLGSTGGDTLTVTQELDPGTGLPQADAAARQVEEVLAGTDEVETYQVTVGSPAGGAVLLGPPGDLGSTATRFAVTLAEDADVEAVAADLRETFDGLNDAGTLTVTAGQTYYFQAGGYATSATEIASGVLRLAVN